jgi:hypothetical protein
MKHLKSYKIFESRLNPIEDYIQSLLDLGFVLTQDNDSPGLSNLRLNKRDLDDSFLSEVFGDYLELVDRLKEVYKLISYNISFSDSGISINIHRVIKDLNDEVEMTEPQKIAYDSVVASLNEDESLRVYRIGNGFIIFDKVSSRYADVMWVTISSDGKINLPILRSSRSQSRTELPFTEEDIKWFKRIMWIDNNLNSSTRGEFDILHRRTQQELREIYK